MFTVEKDIFFRNREHAGKALGAYLEAKYKPLHPLILGIPRGGVEVAYHVARQLQTDFSVVIAKKLPTPGNSELGFGAIAEDYSVYISKYGFQNLTAKVINTIIEEQLKEIERRVKLYRKGKPLPDMANRVVILVDDGIATGATLVPVLKLCQKKKASKVIIAAPVSGSTFDENLNHADAIEVLVKPHPFYAVGQVYESFEDFTDKQVQEILKKSEY